MSDNVLAVLLAATILLLMFLWAPLLSLVCPPCSRVLRRRRTPPSVAGKPDAPAPSSAEAA